MKLYSDLLSPDMENIEFEMPGRGKVTTRAIQVDNNIIENLKKRYIAFDTETTGLNPSRDRIIELGAVLFENGKAVKKFETLVNPGVLIPARVTAVNHITNNMLKNAPNEDVVYSQFAEFMKDVFNEQTVICAHNAKFDMNFLSETLMRLGYNANINYIDTLDFSRKKIIGLYNYKQDTVAHYFDIINEQAHRAASDAETCGKILWNLITIVNSRKK